MYTFIGDSLVNFLSIILLILEETIGEVQVPPSRKLEDLIRLAELCVDLLRQNEEFYAEVSILLRSKGQSV